MSKKWLALLLVLILVGAVVVVQKKQAQNAAFVPPAVPPIQVQSHAVELAPVSLSLPIQVTVKAEVEQLLTSRMTGQVTALPVREGQAVRQGDLLVQLDDKSSRAELSSSDAQLAQYQLEANTIRDQMAATKLDVQAQKDTLSRLKQLAQLKAASDDQLQQQTVRVAQAEQRLSAAQSQLKAYDHLLNARKKQAEAAQGALNYVRLTALQDSVVAERLVQEGDIVTVGAPLIRLVGADGDRRLLVRLPAQAKAPVGLLWQNQQLPLVAWPRVNAQGLMTYEAKVHDTNLVPNQQLAMSVLIHQDAGYLLPSQCMIPKDMTSAKVLIDREGKAEVLTVSLDAVGDAGAVTQHAALKNATLLCASSDILIRLMAGRSYQVSTQF